MPGRELRLFNLLGGCCAIVYQKLTDNNVAHRRRMDQWKRNAVDSRLVCTNAKTVTDDLPHFLRRSSALLGRKHAVVLDNSRNCPQCRTVGS